MGYYIIIGRGYLNIFKELKEKLKMAEKLWEDFLRWDNNASGRPRCIIMKGIKARENPMNSLGLVLYDIGREGELLSQIDRLHFFSSSLWGF